MDALTHLSFGMAMLGCLGLAMISAVVPWVNAEAIVIALPAIAHSLTELVALVIVVTIGQMAGKCVVYVAGRRGLALSERSESKGVRVGTGKIAEGVARWQARAAASPSVAIALVALSSLVGIPPFYVMSAIAGAVRMNLAWFLAAGTAGRLVRFGALAAGALSLSS
jgi:membrane protein YqaA with SNARE-associated domain